MRNKNRSDKIIAEKIIGCCGQVESLGIVVKLFCV